MAAPEPWPGLAPEDRDLVPPLDAYIEDVSGDHHDHDDLASEARGRVWADRQLARLRRLVHEIETHDATANARIDEIKAWQRLVTGRLYERVEQIEQELEAYMRFEADETGVKTLTLPAGELKLRGGPDAKSYRKVVVVGEEDEVAQQLPDTLIQTTHKVVRNAVKQLAVPGPVVEGSTVAESGWTGHTAVLPDSGVVLDGVYFVVPERETFTARPYPYSAA